MSVRTLVGGSVEGAAVVVDGREVHGDAGGGHVLVAGGVAPYQMSLLLRAAGLVAEFGGAVSHAAVVARELGMPCVLGVAGVTRWVVPGSLVRLDADGPRLSWAPPAGGCAVCLRPAAVHDVASGGARLVVVARPGGGVEALVAPARHTPAAGDLTAAEVAGIEAALAGLRQAPAATYAAFLRAACPDGRDGHLHAHALAPAGGSLRWERGCAAAVLAAAGEVTVAL